MLVYMIQPNHKSDYTIQRLFLKNTFKLEFSAGILKNEHILLIIPNIFNNYQLNK